MERWWDGSAWTEYTRTAPVPVPAPQAYPGYQGYPGYDGAAPGAPSGGGRKTGTVVIALVVSLVLIGGVVAGILVLGRSDGKSDAKSGPTPTLTGPGGHRSAPAPQTPDPDDPGGGSQAPRGDGSTAIDAYDQISLPVLDNWTGESLTQGVGAQVTTGDYPCPADATAKCSRGGVVAEPAAAVKEITATTAQGAARQDIAPNAASAYGTSAYGATTSHQELKSGPVTVAGQPGYMVRWKVDTASGTGGYVESLVFASPTTKKLVVVRFGFDVGGSAPGLDVIDQITQGIKSDTSQGTGGTGGTGV